MHNTSFNSVAALQQATVDIHKFNTMLSSNKGNFTVSGVNYSVDWKKDGFVADRQNSTSICWQKFKDIFTFIGNICSAEKTLYNAQQDREFNKTIRNFSVRFHENEQQYNEISLKKQTDAYHRNPQKDLFIDTISKQFNPLMEEEINFEKKPLLDKSFVEEQKQQKLDYPKFQEEQIVDHVQIQNRSLNKEEAPVFQLAGFNGRSYAIQNSCPDDTVAALICRHPQAKDVIKDGLIFNMNEKKAYDIQVDLVSYMAFLRGNKGEFLRENFTNYKLTANEPNRPTDENIGNFLKGLDKEKAYSCRSGYKDGNGHVSTVFFDKTKNGWLQYTTETNQHLMTLPDGSWNPEEENLFYENNDKREVTFTEISTDIDDLIKCRDYILHCREKNITEDMEWWFQ